MVRRTFKIKLDWIPPEGSRGNTRKDRRFNKVERAALKQSGFNHGTALIASEGILEPLSGFSMTYIVYHNHRNIDGDNLLFGFKGFADGLQASGLLENDNLKHMPRLSIEYGGKAEKGESRTVVRIEEIAE